jgi:hypothetical protein
MVCGDRRFPRMFGQCSGLRHHDGKGHPRIIAVNSAPPAACSFGLCLFQARGRCGGPH